MKISASILAADFSNLKSQIQKVERCGADMLHLDVMDGNFVPNISFGGSVIKSLRPYSNLVFDTHLMIENPFDYIEDFIDAGSDIITFHVESNTCVYKTIEKIKSFNKQVGIAFNPGTHIEKVLPFLNLVDVCLVMTVYPGFGGQMFIKKTLEKIKYIKEINPNVQISVDGGVNLETSKILKNYTIDIMVTGTYIFKSKDMQNAILKLKI